MPAMVLKKNRVFWGLWEVASQAQQPEMIHRASLGPKSVIPAAPARKAAINGGVRFPRVNNRQMMTQAAAINQIRARLKYETGRTAPNVSSDEIIARAAKTNTLWHSCVSHPSDPVCTTKPRGHRPRLQVAIRNCRGR